MDRVERVRLAELCASTSPFTDLGTGQPVEHGLRTLPRGDAPGRDARPRRRWAPDWDGLVDSATPLLVTSGTESTQILRSSTEEWARRLPVRWEISTGAGHVPHHRTHAEDYAELLVDCFERSPSGP